MPGIDKDKLDKYASVIYERLEEFNDFTLKTIARRIKEIGSLSAYDAQTLKNMADITGDMKKITKKLAEITEMNIADVEKVYEQTVTDGVNTYKPLYDFRNIPFVPFEENEFAKALVTNWAEQTAGEMINLSRTKAIGFDKYDEFGNVIGHTPLKGAYEQAISSAVAAVSSSTADFNSAMKKTVEELGGSGVKVTYGSGVNRSLSAMIRQNLLYGAKQSAQAYDEHIGRLLGCDGFEVDAHAGCRPSHLFMQGKMYSYNGRVTVDGITYEDGKEALSALGDYGCLHFKDDVILGVSKPRYSKKELDEINRQSTELIEYDGRKKTLYEWKQTQRRFERAVRTKQTQADMFRESGNIAEANMRKKEIAAYRTKYDDLCDKLGLTKRTERMRTYKGKSLTNGKNGGIINVKQGAEMFRKSKGNAIEPMPKHQLHKIEKAFKGQGGTIQRNAEIDAYLKSKNAEAITYNQHIILLKSSPGRASVFEELIHATQYKNGENDGSYLNRLLCEISAQEKLLKYSSAYKLTETEIKQTQMALKNYQKELAEYRKGGKLGV